MPILRMETEQVRSAGRQLRRSAEAICDASQALSRAWAALAADWVGGSRDGFAAAIEGHLRALSNLADTGYALGSRAEAEAGEWESVDGNGAAALSGLGMVPDLAKLGPGGLVIAGGWLQRYGMGGVRGDMEFAHLFQGVRMDAHYGVRSGPMTLEQALEYLGEDYPQRDYLDERVTLYSASAAGGAAAAYGAISGGWGALTGKVGAVEASGHASMQVTAKGLEGEIGGDAGVYLVRADLNAEVAGVEVAADGYLGANLEGKGKVTVNPFDGDAYAGAEVGGFAGGKLEGEVGADLGAVEVGARGSLNAGIGAEFEGEIGMEDWVFKADVDLGLTVGLGADVGFTVELDARQAAHDVVSAVGDVFDL